MQIQGWKAIDRSVKETVENYLLHFPDFAASPLSNGTIKFFFIIFNFPVSPNQIWHLISGFSVLPNPFIYYSIPLFFVLIPITHWSPLSSSRRHPTWSPEVSSFFKKNSLVWFESIVPLFKVPSIIFVILRTADILRIITYLQLSLTFCSRLKTTFIRSSFNGVWSTFLSL